MCVGDWVGKIPQQAWPPEEVDLQRMIISHSADCTVPCVEVEALLPLEGV